MLFSLKCAPFCASLIVTLILSFCIDFLASPQTCLITTDLQGECWSVSDAGDFHRPALHSWLRKSGTVLDGVSTGSACLAENISSQFLTCRVMDPQLCLAGNASGRDFQPFFDFLLAISNAADYLKMPGSSI